MSKIGRKIINIRDGVKVNLEQGVLKVNGPKGDLQVNILHKIKLDITDTTISVSRDSEEKKIKSLHGLIRQLIENAIVGVSEGWTKQLEFKGVGYKVEVQGNKMILNLGFSHPVEIVAPDGIELSTQKNLITISGIDKQLVGQVAANIRKIRPIEPYKLKGIKYIDEIVKKKMGKQAKAASAS